MSRLIALIPLIVVSAGSIAACRPTPPARSTDAGAPVSAATALIRRTAWPRTFEAGGIVRGRSTALVASQILAPVAAVHVRAGERVTRGTVLVTLDRREMSAQRSRAVATLASTTEAVAAAEGALRSAEATLTLARVTRERVLGLFDERAATGDERDRAVAAFEAAEGQVQGARAQLAAAHAGRLAAAAGSDAADAVLSYTTLTAPFDGVVIERRVEPGDMANPGMPLLALEDTSALRLEVTIDDTRAAHVATGQTAAIALADEARWTDATVSEIARVSPDSHAFVVKLDLPAGIPARPGSFARGRFTAASHDTLVIPASAAIRRGQLTFVFIVDSTSQAKLRPISPGALSGDTLEVLAGLREGTRVVIGPSPDLTEGSRVEVGR